VKSSEATAVFCWFVRSKSLGAFYLVQSFAQCFGQLVGTGSTASAAIIALQHSGDICRICAFDQFADGCQIARAAAGELNVMQLASIINAEVNLLAAYPLGLIGIIFHHMLSLNIDKHKKFVHFFAKSIIQDLEKLSSMQKVIDLMRI
jgi:hypothetical protein